MSKLFLLTGFGFSVALFGYAADLPFLGVGVTLATFVAMAVPGALLIRRALPEGTPALPVLVFGTALGLALGRLGLAAVGLLFGPGPLGTIVLMAVLVLSSAIAFSRLGRGALPVWGDADTREGSWILGILGVLFLALALVYWGVGRATPNGHAFAPYFNFDYMNHVSVTAELTRTLPPQNQYFAGERLHYYWCFHLWPAAITNLSGIRAREALNLTILPTVGLFVAALSLWARLYIPSRAARYAAVGLGLFASSYIGLVFLIKVCFPPLARLFPIVSPAEYSFLSHSWFRDSLYEPHAVTALTLLLTVLLLNHSRAARQKPLAGGLIGLGFGAMLVTDAFIAAVGLLYFAATNAYDFLRDPQRRPSLLLAAGLTILVALAAVALGVFPVDSQVLRLALHRATKLAPLYLLVELGPLAVFGALGVGLLTFCADARPFRSPLSLLALALLVGFIVMLPLEPNIALRKSLKVAQLPLVVLAGSAALAIASSSRRTRWVIAGTLVVLPGLSTVCTDTLRYLDMAGSRYPATTYVSGDELEMLDWIRINTPPDAVFQSANPDRLFGPIPDLLLQGVAERRTFFGEEFMSKCFQVPLPLIKQRRDKVRALFAATQPDELKRVLGDFPPLYLYVDETACGPVPVLRQLEAQGVLRHVHQCGRFSLKEVLRRQTDSSTWLATDRNSDSHHMVSRPRN